MKIRALNNVFAAIYFSALFFALSAQTRGYGDPSLQYPTYPSWYERGTLVTVNACRMAPQAFRDKYIGNYQILLEANGYHTVPPLFYNENLNRSSRAYALDMATTCGWLPNHNSCDGTTFQSRVSSYYSNGTIGENKASGNAGPLETTVQLLKEQTPPAPDGTGDDHRAIIMNRDKNFRESGAGYAYSASKLYNTFWVQDFGGGRSNTYIIPSAIHIFPTTTTIAFWLNYYDSTGDAPREIALFLNGTKTAMTLDCGPAGKGTYVHSTTKSTVCRSYYFVATDSKGATWRYPQGGTLRTFKEGNCSEEYMPPTSIIAGRGAVGRKTSLRFDIRSSQTIHISGIDPENLPRESIVVDCQGINIARHTWGSISDVLQENIYLEKPLVAGVYIVRTLFESGTADVSVFRFP